MFFRNNTGGAEWLLVGLGNPGTQYENTRHNVGFLVADELAERQNAPIQRLKFKALTNLLTISGEKVLVMKPVTYMNLSGEAVRQAVDFYKIPPERVLVVSDDTALAVGRLRIRKGGSAGGHNGLKNIIAHLGTDQFPRIKVGVGAPAHPEHEMVDWVIGSFTSAEKKVVEEAVGRPEYRLEDVKGEILKLVIAGDDIRELEALGREVFSGGEYKFAFASRHFTEVVSSRAGKDAAMKKLAEIMKIPVGELFAAGDSMSDLPMLKLAGTSFAAEDAMEAVKACCGHIVPSPVHGGMQRAFAMAMG